MATTRSFVNQQAVTEAMSEQLKESIIEAAEPLIQEALQDIEKKLRQRVVQFAVGSIQRDFDFRMFGEVVEIRVRQGKGATA